MSKKRKSDSVGELDSKKVKPKRRSPLKHVSLGTLVEKGYLIEGEVLTIKLNGAYYSGILTRDGCIKYNDYLMEDLAEWSRHILGKSSGCSSWKSTRRQNRERLSIIKERYWRDTERRLLRLLNKEPDEPKLLEPIELASFLTQQLEDICKTLCIGDQNKLVQH